MSATTVVVVTTLTVEPGAPDDRPGPQALSPIAATAAATSTGPNLGLTDTTDTCRRSRGDAIRSGSHFVWRPRRGRRPCRCRLRPTNGPNSSTRHGVDG